MAQIEPYIIDGQAHHLKDDENHPSLSSVPSPPGPELDSKRYHVDKSLPEPPVFSPPSTNTTFDDISFQSEDLADSLRFDSSFHPDAESSTLDSFIQNASAIDNEPSIEPQTLESITPSTDFATSIGSDHHATHLDGQSPEIVLGKENNIHKPEVSDPINVSKSASQDLLTLKPSPSAQEKQLPIEDVAKDAEINHKHEASVPRSKTDSRAKQAHSDNQSKSALIGDWTDISQPKVQFALGLFAVPWSSLIILSRSINQIWFLAFDQPIVHPISGILASIIAPSLLYGSLVTLFITSLAHMNS